LSESEDAGSSPAPIWVAQLAEPDKPRSLVRIQPGPLKS